MDHKITSVIGNLLGKELTVCQKFVQPSGKVIHATGGQQFWCQWNKGIYILQDFGLLWLSGTDLGPAELLFILQIEME